MTSGPESAEERSATDARRASVRDAFIRERGFWAPPFEAILLADPDFLEAYVAFSGAPWRHGPLEPKVKEFIYIAADAAVTHLHPVGTASHIRSALRHGATPAELASVLQVVSLIGLQSLELGMPLLLAEAGLAPEEDTMAALARLDSAGAEGARGWIETVLGSSPLPVVVIELIGVAVNASTTHLNQDATAAHVRAALAAGATPLEIAEVLELVSVLGIHSALMAMPMLLDALQPDAD
ncbi:hypothetical protein BH09ACT12_BH09ACT12_14770 [soil metagenome]